MVLTLDVAFLVPLVDEALHLGHFFWRDDSGIKELLLVQSSDWGHLSDLLVHERLGETGLVEFVVAVLAVADQVDNHILLVGLSVSRSCLEDLVDILQAVSVHVEDWSIDCLSEIGGVHCRPSFLGSGSESNLVVHNDMDGSSNGVVREILHLHGFVDDTLSCEGSISMD